MRRSLLFIFTVFSLLSARAQFSKADADELKGLLTRHASRIGLTGDDLNNYVISSTYVSPEGIRYAYLYQSYKGIPVYNQMHVLAFRNGQLLSVAGGRIPSLAAKVNNPTGRPSLPAGRAVLSALQDAGIPAGEVRGSLETPLVNEFGKLDFGRLGVTSENINAELFWYPVQGKDYRLVWQVFVAPLRSSDMWSVKVDAATGEVLGKDNYTVYCDWHKEPAAICYNQPHQVPAYRDDRFNMPVSERAGRLPVVNSATYRVVKYPAESPQHPGGAPSLHTDPWTMAAGNATSLKWHNDGTLEHDSTRGNNVWAAEDRANTNAVPDKTALSTTPQPTLTFDYVPDLTQSPLLTTPPNQQFNITNLFYMNNIMHDITYLYGFNEVSGNFQKDNQGRGGVGNDFVYADAQDGGGTNNANFATPPDGSNPRMQMYIWTAPNPDRDGDADNGIISHEFAHGISNRLTGGPANTSCLGNAEQAGEGWSDYYALMVTTNWATASVTDGALARPIGTYALGQATTGPGIRNFPYSTNLAINPLVYSASIPAQVHNRGEYWCAALWEMTWAMIQQTGINPNLFDPNGVGGNSAALKLVTEGMKLQPCSPGFIDGRDAILKADTIFFGAQYSCAIWAAFAKRGMGRGASQGSSNSVTDQVPSFAGNGAAMVLNENFATVAEGQNVTYTTKVTADICGTINNFFITDTLPTNVTYVSGGNYNAANRVVTFNPVSLAAGQSQTYPVTVSVNPGSYFAPVTHFTEPVASAAIPASWTATSVNSVVWTAASGVGNGGTNCFYAPNSSTLQTDLQLATTAAYTLNPNTVSNYTTLSFWHRYNTEDGWDGGVVEISTDNGVTWSDLGSKMIIGKYNGSLGTGSNLAGRAAFTGTNGASFMQTVINLSSYAGQSVKVRFRFGTDNNTAPVGGGWWVDDIVLYSEPAVQMRSSLFNASSVRQSFSDTLTRITVGCQPAAITTPPANVNTCTGGNATFTIVASGAGVVYQWQENTGSGFVNVPAAAPYSGTTTANLTITGVTAGMNGYLYRCVVSNSCTAPINSTSAQLSIGTVASISSHPANVALCPGAPASFSVTATGATSYQWQVNTGSGFADLSNTAPYSGVNTATLNISAPTAGMNGYQYRCVLGSCGSPVNSNAATLTVTVPVSITTHPADVAVCARANATLTIGTTGTVLSYQWQISTDNGATYAPVAGATTATLALTQVMPGQQGYRYRCVVTGGCGPVTSNAAVITVNPLPDFTFSNVPVTLCISDPAYGLSASVSGGTWSGTGVSGSTFNPAAAGTGTKTVTYTVTSLGCTTAKSTVVQVNECSERHRLLNANGAVLVYPNPNNGQFSIRMNSDLYTRIGLKVFDSDGRLVANGTFNGLGYGSVVPVDITRLPSAVYHLYIYNDENGFISKGVSLIIYRN